MLTENDKINGEILRCDTVDRMQLIEYNRILLL